MLSQQYGGTVRNFLWPATPSTWTIWRLCQLYIHLFFYLGGWRHITLQSFGDIYNLKRIIFMCSRGNNEVSNEGNAMKNETATEECEQFVERYEWSVCLSQIWLSESQWFLNILKCACLKPKSKPWWLDNMLLGHLNQDKISRWLLVNVCLTWRTR